MRAAVEAFEQCLRLRPDWFEAQVNLGLALLARRRP